MSQTQRTKGHSFERKIAADLRLVGFPEARRHLEYQEGNGIDLEGTSPFSIQCKAMKKVPNLPQVFSEIKALEGSMPLVVFKVDNKGEFACLKWDDFRCILRTFFV